MKTVTGRVISTEPISLSKAATLLSGFASSDNGATQAVSAYLRRASDAFNELRRIHREIKSSSGKEKKSKSDARRDRNLTGEPEELVGAKGVVDDLVGKEGKVRFRESEALSEKVSALGQEQYEMKEDKKKRKKTKEKEDVVDEKVKEKLEDEQRNQERKERKKKRKSDEEMGLEERKSKKKRKSKEIDD